MPQLKSEKFMTEYPPKNGVYKKMYPMLRSLIFVNILIMNFKIFKTNLFSKNLPCDFFLFEIGAFIVPIPC
jgi:hypothetical protein